MDLQLVRKLTLYSTIWLSLFLSIILTNTVSSSSSWIAWPIYSILVGIAFLGIKLWNRSLQDPLFDVNLTYLEMSVSIALAILVAFFGGKLIQLDLLKSTVWLLLLGYTMTACQFALLKVGCVTSFIIITPPSLCHSSEPLNLLIV